MQKIKLFIFPIVFFACVIILSFLQEDMEIYSYSDGPYLFDKSSKELTVLNFIEDNNTEKRQIEVNYKKIDSQKILSYLFKESFDKKDTIISVDRFSEYKSVSKIFAVGDVHGEYDGLLKLLKSNHIIDKNSNWIFGNGHLVFCGDVFDRGNQVTESLWLIYKLEQQAVRQGGMIHYILGNHELMVLGGDLRYLHKKYRYNQSISYLSYSSLFNSHSLLGGWIRQQNTVVKINDNVFVHGGLAPEILKYDIPLDSINSNIRGYLSKGQFSSLTNDLIGSNGPLWYRGYLRGSNHYSQAKEENIEQLLEKYDVNRIVFAHTKVEQITPLYNGKLIGIDVNLTKENAEALFIDQSNLYRVNANGLKEKL